MEHSQTILSEFVKQKAIEIGFHGVGISKAEKLQGFDTLLDSWLQNGYHAQMEYMARNREKRSDPTELVPGAKSVISLIISYYPERVQNSNVPQVAKYAYGKDYHFVLKDMMQQLWDEMKLRVPDLDGRMFVDSAPVSDKLWAVKAGLGWLGKNSCLINKEIGSFVFVSELIVNVPLAYDEPYPSNFCGSCTRCLDACPTQAIVQPGVIDSNRCISFHTIENKTDTIDPQWAGHFGNRLFGCDVCQDVCPWNKHPWITQQEAFKPDPSFFRLDWEAWEQLEPDTFNRMFKKSPLKRAKWSGLQRNLRFIRNTEASKKGE